MRLALISDIHANMIALEAVLADIEQSGVDQIIFLGDALTLGPQPRDVADRLRALACPGVLGNHDEVLLTLPRLRHHNHADWYIAQVEWCVAQLEPADFAFLQTFQPTLTIPLGPAKPDLQLLACHGSPQSNTDQIMPTTSDPSLEQMLAGQTASIIACGHTHLALIRRLKQQTIINTGSVGAPFSFFPSGGAAPRLLPWAEYGLVELRQGRLAAELRQVPLDVAAIKAVALASDMPDPAGWADAWPG